MPSQSLYEFGCCLRSLVIVFVPLMCHVRDLKQSDRFVRRADGTEVPVRCTIQLKFKIFILHFDNMLPTYRLQQYVRAAHCALRPVYPTFLL